MQFKVTLESGEEVLVGADETRHLEISIRMTRDEEQPKVEGRAYVFNENEFSEYRSWDIGSVKIGQSLKVDIVEGKKVDDPSRIEFSSSFRQSYTEGTKAYIKDQIIKTRNAVDDLRSGRNTVQAEVCSFCGKRKEEVAHLIPKNSVAICNECVAICNEVIESKSA